jgi:hypothetical protein
MPASTPPAPPSEPSQRGTWGRRAPWVLVLGVAFMATSALVSSLGVDPFPNGVPVGFAPTMVLALLVGVRLRERWWVAAPALLAAPVVAAGVGYLLMGALAAGSGAAGYVTYFGRAMVGYGIVFALGHAAAAGTGVWLGRRRPESPRRGPPIPRRRRPADGRTVGASRRRGDGARGAAATARGRAPGA